ncbi:MAG: antitoxin [Gammaproteobacteria bacterium]|nr:antitoxin [Gammaproteobacteria bacterium]
MKSVTTVSSVGTALVMGLLLVTLFGCEKGPAERAGENVDEAIDKAGDQIEKSGDDIQDAVSDDKR